MCATLKSKDVDCGEFHEALLPIAAESFNAEAIELIRKNCGDTRFQDMTKYLDTSRRTSLHVAAIGYPYMVPVD